MVNVQLSVIIPVYNEAKTLKQLLERVQQVKVSKEIIIISDHSTDGSRDILKAYQKEHEENTKIYYFDKNMGKGAALRCGIHYAQGDFVIIQDADLEYDPNDYLKLLAAVDKYDAGVVYGSRFQGVSKNFIKMHFIGNKVLTWLFNLLYGTKLTDMETCYKLWRRDIIQALKINSNRFDIEPEVTAKVVRQGLLIHEVPITYEARGFDQGKKISWKDGFSAVFAILRYRFF